MDILTPPEITESAKSITAGLLPEKSRKLYEAEYEAFIAWRKGKNTSSFSENVLLAYFSDLSEKYASSSLWCKYSKLRSTVQLNDGVNLEEYSKLRSFLKRKSENFVAKKSLVFTPEEIKKFINEAPNEMFLVSKVIFINIICNY